jgi:hypothetical protein
MSKLEFYSRPLIAFDPSKKEHRDLYNQFAQKQSWGHSPYRFICPEGSQFDLPKMMQNELLAWYLDKEFGKPVAVETNRKEVQNISKLVDRA